MRAQMPGSFQCLVGPVRRSSCGAECHSALMPGRVQEAHVAGVGWSLGRNSCMNAQVEAVLCDHPVISLVNQII